MRITFRPWRLRPLSSFLGFMDIKTGVTIALLFALLNKVAGVYGLIAVLTGAGGSLPQLSMYIYSVLGLAGLVWALKAVSEEDAKRTLYFAHLFFADHILSTAWTVFFAVVWWKYTPHDGRRVANSAAQQEMMNEGAGSLNMTTEERVQAAMMIWNKEKGTAATVIIAGWLIKFYFAYLIYSYASHLRQGSYRTLPRTKPNPTNSQYAALPSSGTNHHRYFPSSLSSTSSDDELATFGQVPAEDDLEDIEFYRAPRRSAPPSLTRTSVPTYTEFVNSASSGRARRFKPLTKTYSTGAAGGKGGTGGDEEIEEVLFDEDEMQTMGSGGHLKMGTEESTNPSSPDEELPQKQQQQR